MNTLWEKVPFIASMIKNSAFVEFVKQRYRRLNQAQSRNKSTQTKLLEGIQDAKMMSLWNAATEYLTEFKNLSKKHGFELLLVAIPGRNQVLREYPESSYPKKLKEIADDRADGQRQSRDAQPPHHPESPAPLESNGPRPTEDQRRSIDTRRFPPRAR